MPDDMVTIDVPIKIRMPRAEFLAWGERENCDGSRTRRNIRAYVLGFVKDTPMLDEAKAIVTLSEAR